MKVLRSSGIRVIGYNGIKVLRYNVYGIQVKCNRVVIRC